MVKGLLNSDRVRRRRRRVIHVRVVLDPLLHSVCLERCRNYQCPPKTVVFTFILPILFTLSTIINYYIVYLLLYCILILCFNKHLRLKHLILLIDTLTHGKFFYIILFL